MINGIKLPIEKKAKRLTAFVVDSCDAKRPIITAKVGPLHGVQIGPSIKPLKNSVTRTGRFDFSLLIFVDMSWKRLIRGESFNEI